MTRMIFVRHGQSTGNRDRLFYGHFDGELSELGRAQARAARDYLKDVHIDIAYASDLKRAYETGAIIAEPHGLTPIPSVNLRENNAGLWECRPFAELPEKYPEIFATWRNDVYNAILPEGESVKDLTRRIHDEVWRIATENDGKTVLVAFHATPIRTLNCEWIGIPYERMNEVDWVKNASVSIVNYYPDTHKTEPEIIGYADFQEGVSTEVKFE